MHGQTAITELGLDKLDSAMNSNLESKITVPAERTRALVQSGVFLHRIASLGDGVVALSIATAAGALLQQYLTICIPIRMHHAQNRKPKSDSSVSAPLAPRDTCL